VDFSNLIEDNRRELITDVLYRIEDKLRPFHESLYAFLATLFLEILPDEWREQWHAFIAEQEAEGFTIAESSIAELETWIEAWAKDCKLWPEEPERFPDEEGDEESESTFIISIIPDVSGPHRSKKSTSKSQVTSTKVHVPADIRGGWVEGTKGDGVFQYDHSPQNVRDGVAGMEVRFENQFIAEKGLPKSVYYFEDPDLASVALDDPKGTGADNTAADAKMREKLGDPNWQRPKGYTWNHAGAPGSKLVELVKTAIHKIIAHKSYAAILRGASVTGSIVRGGTRSVRGATGRALNVLDVYLTTRDALQSLGILGPTYEVRSRMTYTFEADDGSLFIVWPAGWIRGASIEFISGPRTGEKVSISTAEVDRFRIAAEKIWGRYIPATIFRQSRFIPGTKRKSIPYYTIDEYGLEREAGWVDEDGEHPTNSFFPPVY
jgi:hypothetical protein